MLKAYVLWERLETSGRTKESWYRIYWNRHSSRIPDQSVVDHCKWGEKMEQKVFEEMIYGIEVDATSRCTHWHSPLNIIAIKFSCCGKWFPCYSCHAELTDHSAGVWKTNEFDSEAILCGECGNRLTIDEYMACSSACPSCGASFNPGCANHYHLYFQI